MNSYFFTTGAEFTEASKEKENKKDFFFTTGAEFTKMLSFFFFILSLEESMQRSEVFKGDFSYRKPPTCFAKRYGRFYARMRLSLLKTSSAILLFSCLFEY